MHKDYDNSAMTRLIDNLADKREARKAAKKERKEGLNE